MSDKGVCRSAPAQTGLFIIVNVARLAGLQGEL